MEIHKQLFFLFAVTVVVIAGIGGEVLAVYDGEPREGNGPATSAVGIQPNGEINESVRQMAMAARGAGLGPVLEGRQVNVHVTKSDGTTVTLGVEFESGEEITVQQGGFTDPALSSRLSETTLESIATSPNPSKALEKAIKYDLVSIGATDPGDQLLTGLATSGTKIGAQSRIASARIDLDNDPQPDAILEIEALSADEDGEFDRLVRTVLRDTDDDGEMDTVTSETRPISSTVSGSVNLDLNHDGTRDTLLRLTGQDTNTDGQLDQRSKTTLIDTRDDPQFDSFAETVEPVSAAMAVIGEWDLNDDGTVNARLKIQGEDIDGDDSFDRQTLTISLNLDGEPGFESSSSTTARINPTLSIAAEFDTDGDGTPDTKASLSTSDSNDDGGLDSESVSVVNDSDGDGIYDSVVQRDEFRRGFISNEGEPIQYLNDPQNLTIIGVVASILSMLLQLIQGG